MRDYKVMLRELEPASSTMPPRGPLALSNDTSLMRHAAHSGARAATAENDGAHNAGPGHNLGTMPIEPTPSGATRNEVKISKPDDEHELEADRVSKQIGGAATGSQASFGQGNLRRALRTLSSLRQTVSGNADSAGLAAAVQDVVNSPGQALDNESRSLMEPRLGHDFSKVRVHTDNRAAESARALGALAYTLGPDIVFGAGSYEPSSPQGRRLLAHELTHVVQQSGTRSRFTNGAIGVNPAPLSLALQRHLGHGTNYRFDTHQVTAADLTDPEIVERFNEMSIEGLRAYIALTTDGAVIGYIQKLIAAKSVAQLKAAAQVDRADYLSKVQDAVQQLKGPALEDKTLSSVLYPLLDKLSQPKNVIWKDAAGAESGGKTVPFKPSGKGAKTISMLLVLDEIDPSKEKRGGYFDANTNRIVLVVRNEPTAGGIRDVLYHEGTHMVVNVLQSQGENAIGGKAESAVKGLQASLNKSGEIEKLKGSLEQLRVSLNSSRARRGEKRLDAALAEKTAAFLWEEISVRAETFYFEVLRYESQGEGEKPKPNYLDKDSLKDIYLKSPGFLADSDLAGLTSDDDAAIGLISQFLLYRMRSLIMARGVRREYVPNPLEPKPPVFVIERTKLPDPGPIIKLEDLQPDFLKKISPGPNQPPF